MSAKDTIEKIKEVLFGNMPAPPPPPPGAPVPPAVGEPKKESMATEYKTIDGVVLSIDNLAIGGMVTIDGNPAPDGDYTLEDGTSISVMGGAIAEVSSAAEEAQPGDMGSWKNKMSELEQRMSAHEQAFGVVSQEFATAKATIAKQDEAIKGLLSVVEQLAAMPKEEPAVAPKTFREIKDNKSRLDQIAKNLEKLSKN